MTSLDPGYEELAFSHPGIYFFRPRWPGIEFCMLRTQHPPLACGLYLCKETLKMRNILYFVKGRILWVQPLSKLQLV